jgi:hypothetical protein
MSGQERAPSFGRLHALGNSIIQVLTQLESDQLPPEEMIDDAPSWALDVYSRKGRAALARFLQTDAPAARWIRRNVGPTRRLSFLGHIVFRVEGGLIVNRMPWPLAQELRRRVDYECSGRDCPDAAEILELSRADMPLLNKARVAVMGAPSGLRPTWRRSTPSQYRSRSIPLDEHSSRGI